jgi:hypothetical protein
VPSTSGAIRGAGTTRQEYFKYRAFRQKQEGPIAVDGPARPKTEQRIVAFQLIGVLPREADGRMRKDVRLSPRILILPKLATTFEYSRREITLVPSKRLYLGIKPGP